MIIRGVCIDMSITEYILHTLRTSYRTVRIKTSVRLSKEIL
jgi:hypothetical protein